MLRPLMMSGLGALHDDQIRAGIYEALRELKKWEAEGLIDLREFENREK